MHTEGVPPRSPDCHIHKQPSQDPGQPVQGENITASKKEIEETIDTLNIAFEKLLDSIFRDTAWDVSTDISVLHTVLAQEGLTEDDFEKMKQNAEMK